MAPAVRFGDPHGGADARRLGEMGMKVAWNLKNEKTKPIFCLFRWHIDFGNRERDDYDLLLETPEDANGH